MRKFIPADQRKLIDTIKDAGLNRLVPKRSSYKTAEQHTGSDSIKYAGIARKRHKDNEILVTVGCSSYEVYGLNSNGDGFPSEKEYPEYGITEKDLLTNNYKTFENAEVYYMHDMENAIGWVLKAFWNDRYKWVELVIELDHERCPEDIFVKLRKGEMIFVSMGCAIAYDVCTVCGNKAPDEGSYCTHIKDRLMDVIGGIVSGMLNPSPRFDDISVVFIPAEALAGSIYRKTASGMSFVKGIGSTTKVAEVKKKLCKMAEIYKDTRNLKAIEKFKDFYDPLVGRMEEGIQDSVVEAVAFFYRNPVPMPVVAMAGKYGVDSAMVLDIQSDIIAKVIGDDVLSDLAEKTASGDVDALKTLCAELNPGYDGDSADTEKEAIARLLAVFNIINKLKVSNEGVEVVSLPVKAPDVTDIKDIIELEFLTGGA